MANIPTVPEIDQHGGDDLPTYDDLAVQNGPNSRFGRWREWVEKRAAERYADLTPEAYARRRQKGWGDPPGQPGQPQPRSQLQPEPLVLPRGNPSTAAQIQQTGPPPGSVPPFRLHVETQLNGNPPPETPPDVPPPDSGPSPSVGESLAPSRLKLHQFGSRFLPHTTAPIRCLLPILGDRFLLIGHDDGLSVMDMYPKEWTELGLSEKGPNDAQVRPVWTGEGVYQMSILEAESTGEGTPQGVVLALVGPDDDSPKDQESVRALRMYNLASLVSLAKWAVVQKPGSRPLDLRQISPSKTPNASPSRKHRNRPSLAKGLRNLMAESPIQPVNTPTKVDLNSVFPDSPSTYTNHRTPLRHDSDDSLGALDSSWDLVEDLPIRWSLDYVPLASSGSRLLGIPVLAFALWKDENQRSRGGYFLSVITKSNIFLYETPKNERAFRFVKEFYTPITARSVTFVHQAVGDPVSRSPSDASPRVLKRNTHHAKGLSIGHTLPQYPHQLSLFVVFEKKAGLIRIADSAVGEVELCDENKEGSAFPLLSAAAAAAANSGTLNRRSRASWDGKGGFLREHKATWVPPIKIVLPGPANRPYFSQSMYLLTRGKHSYILPYPLPANLTAFPPHRTLTWNFAPAAVSVRVCIPLPGEGIPAFIQVIAFGEDGLEVHEVPFTSISERKGKGKSKATGDEPIHAMTDAGGETGFLCPGGHWHRAHCSDLARNDSAMSCDSSASVENFVTDTSRQMRVEEGIYGWVRRGMEDWRVFWVGGTSGRAEEDVDDIDSTV